MNIVEQSVELWSMTPDPIKLIEKAGRVCYQSESKGNSAKFVQSIIKRGHESVIEHASATFCIICDRGITHEIVRHRLASYSQESTRFVKYDDITVIEPPGLSKEEQEAWNSIMFISERTYAKLLKNQKAQIARSVLPTCLKTQIVMTANFREWRHFLKLRMSKAAHPQIRVIASQIHKIFMDSDAAPVFEDIEFE